MIMTMDYGFLTSRERLVVSYWKAQKLNAVNGPRSAAFYNEMFIHIHRMHMHLSASIQTSAQARTNCHSV